MKTTGSFWSVLLSFWAAALLSVLYATGMYFVLVPQLGSAGAFREVEFFVYDYGALITGTACATLWFMSILVLPIVPKLIESAVSNDQFEQTDYHFWRTRFHSFHHGLAQFATYFLGGFAIYSLLEFPNSDRADIYFVIFAAFQYAFGGFLGRKLWCIGHMLRSLEDVTPLDDLLEQDAFPRLIYVINIFTFLTLLMTVVHTYFHAQINYETSGPASGVAWPLVFLPLVLALPVLVLFNFYPRMVVNRLYLKSIELKKEWLTEKMSASKETEIAKIKHSIDYEKYLSEEFRYRQKVALSELPVALTVAIALIVTAARIFVS